MDPMVTGETAGGIKQLKFSTNALLHSINHQAAGNACTPLELLSVVPTNPE
jgi:hypothetical protein